MAGESWMLCRKMTAAQLAQNKCYLFVSTPVSSDINECLIGAHNCVAGQVCINTDGSFRCQRETSCGTGYELRDDNTCLGK